MDATTKAYLKIGLGFAKGANAVAGGLGYGALSFLTGNHHRSAHALQLMRYGLMSAKGTIDQGKEDLAKATGR